MVDGVKINVFANDHPPPHFHAEFAEHVAVIRIDTLETIRGSIPIAKKRKVLKWARTHGDELARAFDQAIAKLPIDPIG